MANIDDGFRVDVISLDDLALIVSRTDDPTVGAGFEAPVGSLYLRSNGTNYIKTNTGDVDWSAIVTTPSPITLSTIGGQTIPTYVDTTRSKTLSVELTQFLWSEDAIGDNDWISIGGAVDADSGFIVPLNATIVFATGHCENTNGNTKDIDLFINTTNAGSIGQFTGAGQQTFNNTTLNIDVTAGQRLRLIGRTGQGTIQDTIVSLHLRWRA